MCAYLPTGLASDANPDYTRITRILLENRRDIPVGLVPVRAVKKKINKRRTCKRWRDDKLIRRIVDPLALQTGGVPNSQAVPHPAPLHASYQPLIHDLLKLHLDTRKKERFPRGIIFPSALQSEHERRQSSATRDRTI